MKIEQLYTKCLSESAYYVESKNEVAIIDPLRDVDVYIEMAEKSGSSIKYIFETHFHADFVSGHLELAKRTGAKIIYGPNADPNFEFYSAKDNECFSLGNIFIKAIHTPGHTLESTCFLLKNENGSNHCIFTGDTLFVGDVGRPDLAVKSDILSKEDLAGMLFDSLHEKISVLEDHVLVYPAHGAGSACGKNIGSETFTTIGEQKAKNYALQPMPKEDFIAEVTNGLLAPPKYFFTDVMMNKNGGVFLQEILDHGTVRLDVNHLLELNDEIILDTRSPNDFSKGFFKGSINIGLNGQFAPWVGSLIDTNKKLILICNQGTEKEAITRLARVGFDNIKGYININDIEQSRLITIENLEPEDAANLINTNSLNLLDVRKPGELEKGFVLNSKHIRLQELESRLHELDKDTSILVYCAGGYRSMISCSILAKNGFKKLINISGGFSKLKHEKIPLSKNTCFL